MKVNTPPYNDDLIGDSESKIGHTWSTYHAILSDQINKNLGDFGYLFPAITTETANNIVQDKEQTIVYNSDQKKMQLNNDGSGYEQIATISSKTTDEISELIKDPSNIGRIYINSDLDVLQFSLDGITIKSISTS